MNENFLSLPPDTQRKILLAAASQLGQIPSILEKDIWLCWILQQLFLLPEKMAFKGGTSLSKVYDLIQRFSEDVDITLDYTNFSIDMNLIQSVSKLG